MICTRSNSANVPDFKEKVVDNQRLLNLAIACHQKVPVQKKNCTSTLKKPKRSIGKENKPVRKSRRSIVKRKRLISSITKSSRTLSSTSSTTSSAASWTSSSKSSESLIPSPEPETSPMQQPEFLAALGLCTLQVREELKKRRSKRTLRGSANKNFHNCDLKVGYSYTNQILPDTQLHEMVLL
ncbi:hypothetical protein HHI36_002404 [Cryptolaemus montrouzieri]|uniref:Uncharacterized protein n=1 Tax=Cryptolaemus montrouzieri TaxID=559131 RepID=A0ABD2PB27_9CUCU